MLRTLSIWTQRMKCEIYQKSAYISSLNECLPGNTKFPTVHCDRAPVQRPSSWSLVLVTRTGGHPTRRTSGVSWKWKSDGGDRSGVICNFLDVYKLPSLASSPTGGRHPRPLYSLIVSPLFVEMGYRPQLSADALAHCLLSHHLAM